MIGFQVWVRPMDYEYHVTVDGLANANWLLDRLSRSFVFKNAVPLDSNGASGMCSFQVPFTNLLPFSIFRRLLAGIPEVTLEMKPALA